MKIAIVNDTLIAIEVLRRLIATVPQYELIWTARHGREAILKCAAMPPDIILMDLIMPEMDGVETTRQIMQQSPCAILIVTATIKKNAGKVFEAMGYGALDVVSTPVWGTAQPSQVSQELLKKIATLGKLIRQSPAKNRRTQTQLPFFDAVSKTLPPLVVIGASTGGPNALRQILGDLPGTYPGAIIVIQHIDHQFATGLATWLNQETELTVEVAYPGTRPQAGKVLIAASADHLVLRPQLTLNYTEHPKELVYRPSVDVLFHSVAEHWPQPGMGVLLTGMGQDGATGLAALKLAGWHTIAQDQKSCVVYGMPKAAIALGAAVEVLSLEAIAGHLNPPIGINRK